MLTTIVLIALNILWALLWIRQCWINDILQEGTSNLVDSVGLIFDVLSDKKDN